MTTSEYPNAYRYRRIVQAKRYIDEHFENAIDLKEISDEACFSQYHFLRLFKSAFGKTPWQYLVELRSSRATELLEKDRYSVTEICYEMGFKSVGSFSSLCKKSTGLSPTAYRDKMRQRRVEIYRQPLTVVPNCFASHFSWT